jgi:hypothetical protein
MLKRPRTWFVLTVLLLIATVIVGGTIGGILAALTFGAFVVAVILRVRGESPEDRTVGTGMFGGGGGF